MPSRKNDSTLSGSPASHVYGSVDTFNAGISENEFNSSQNFDSTPTSVRASSRVSNKTLGTSQSLESQQRGSGSDVNSDSDRLGVDQNLLDKEIEDSFPASDPPSHSPMTGIARAAHDGVRTASEIDDPSGLASNFKDDKPAQFEYGRKSQASTQRFDRSEDRLRKGNPDIGEVDLGNIEDGKPSQPDDNDHFD